MGTLRSSALGLAIALAPLAFGCSDEGSSGNAGTGGSSGAGGSAGAGGSTSGCPGCPDPVCTSGTRWEKGTAAFKDVTAEWGLTGVLGQRINVTDIDNDGWADVVVRRAVIQSDDLSGRRGVRSVWVLRNTGQRGFRDVSKASGFLAMRSDTSGKKGRPGQVMAFGDVDNDGDIDGFTALDTSDTTKSGAEHSEIMLGDGTGKFSLGPEDSAARSADRPENPAGASFIDYDRDGNLDLWVPQNDYASPGQFQATHQQNRLYRGDGTGRFTEVTDSVGLTTMPWTQVDEINQALAHTISWAAAACDLNGDGTPELLAASYGRAPNHLWQGVRNGSDVSFLNRSIASGYAFDSNQTWQDNQFARCYCKNNPSAQDCAGAPAPQISCSQVNWNHSTDREPFRLGGNSATTSCADIDNDGDIDLFTGEIKHWWAGEGADGSEVLVNTGQPDVTFERPSDAALGLKVDHPAANWDEGHMTNAVFDFDNDGWPDIYVGASDYAGNHGLLYHQGSKLSFTEVPVSEGIDHHRSHGVVFADFDHDGDLDVLVGHSRARCDASAPDNCYATENVRLFENVLGQAGNFVQIRLIGGAGSNRSAIGARVSVTADGVTQTQEVGGGFGHYGAQHDLVLHFGLGKACSAKVSIRWPDAELTTESWQLPAGHRFDIEQGKSPFALPRAPAAP